MGSSINLEQMGIRLHGEEVQLQRRAVCDLLNDHIIRFPGAQPVSFARKHLQELRNVDYFMCEKTDGIRCLLFLTQIFVEGETVEAQFLIDRKNDYYYVPRDVIHLPTPEDKFGFHTGTLLDGELVRQKFRDGQERIAYLIFDCLAMDGENVTQKPFDKRLARIDALISKPYKAFARQYADDVANQPFQLEMKPMEFPYGVEMMFREKIPKLPHGNDGLIFTCKNTPYKMGTDDHILKWKPPHENTIDFRLIIAGFPMLEDEQGEYEDWDAKPDIDLYINHGSKLNEGNKKYGELYITEAEWAGMKGMNVQLDGQIIECYKDSGTDRWRPKMEREGIPRFRTDKKDPNHISVAHSVRESIDDAVTEQDLINAAPQIREAFKARLKAREDEQKRMEEAERRKRQDAVKADEEAKRRASEAMDHDDGPTYSD